MHTKERQQQKSKALFNEYLIKYEMTNWGECPCGHSTPIACVYAYVYVYVCGCKYGHLLLVFIYERQQFKWKIVTLSTQIHKHDLPRTIANSMRRSCRLQAKLTLSLSWEEHMKNWLCHTSWQLCAKCHAVCTFCLYCRLHCKFVIGILICTLWHNTFYFLFWTLHLFYIHVIPNGKFAVSRIEFDMSFLCLEFQCLCDCCHSDKILKMIPNRREKNRLKFHLTNMKRKDCYFLWEKKCSFVRSSLTIFISMCQFDTV